jgi:hypothetical protein
MSKRTIGAELPPVDMSAALLLMLGLACLYVLTVTEPAIALWLLLICATGHFVVRSLVRKR